jgi:hypothetical protein
LRRPQGIASSSAAANTDSQIPQQEQYQRSKGDSQNHGNVDFNSIEQHRLSVEEKRLQIEEKRLALEERRMAMEETILQKKLEYISTTSPAAVLEIMAPSAAPAHAKTPTAFLEAPAPAPIVIAEEVASTVEVVKPVEAPVDSNAKKPLIFIR